MIFYKVVFNIYIIYKCIIIINLVTIVTRVIDFSKVWTYKELNYIFKS